MVDSQHSKRHEFIVNLLRRGWEREVVAIHGLGRNTNNYVYRVELAKRSPQALSSTAAITHRPGTEVLPPDETDVVIRMSNPHALLNEEARVQNEVAAMKLMREALSGHSESLVPRVFGWSPASEGRGWIMQEFKHGLQLDAVFGGLPEERQVDVLNQVAAVYKLIQDFRVPNSVQGYGGLSFDDSGRVRSGPTTIPCGGPFSQFYEMYAQMLRRQLDETDTSERLRGWRRNSLRDRLERFASQGIAQSVNDNAVSRQTLIHGDFNMFNMLYDTASSRLVALLDFDLSHIASPADEYFYSFRTFGSLLAGPFEEGDEGRLRCCLLQGFDGNVPSKSDGKGRVNWAVARAFDRELFQAGVLRPADIPGCGELAGLKWFLEDVSPPYFYMPRWLENRKASDIDEIQNSIEQNLDKYLQRWGF